MSLKQRVTDEAAYFFLSCWIHVLFSISSVYTNFGNNLCESRAFPANIIHFRRFLSPVWIKGGCLGILNTAQCLHPILHVHFGTWTLRYYIFIREDWRLRFILVDYEILQYLLSMFCILCLCENYMKTVGNKTNKKQ